MKARTILMLLVGVALAMGTAWAEEGAKEKPKDSKAFECPHSRISNQDKCFDCHGKGRDFKKIKEADPDDLRDYPNTYMTIRKRLNGKEYGNFRLEGTVDYCSTGKFIEDFFFYLEKHGISDAEIEIQSGGGAVFEGWRIVSLMDQWQKRGIKVTTLCRSFAGSAALTIFLGGDTRLASPTCSFMAHELWTFKFLSIETPSDQEEQSKILRKLQDTISAWMAARTAGKVSKDEIDKRVKKREWWLTGAEAKDLNIATGYIE